MGFTFDSPISVTYTAAEKANKKKPRGIPLPSKAKKRSLSSSFTNFLGRSNSLSSPTSPALPTPAPRKPASESHFFRLPPAIREKIYGYVVGRDEVIHILLKRKASKGYYLGHRKCRADGNRDDCIVSNCKQFCDVVNGVYFGYFDSRWGLLLSCRDISKEVKEVLYGRNTFDFDHPLSLILFRSQLSPTSFQSITSTSLDLGKYLYDPKSGIKCKSFQPSQWGECWDSVARMEGLEEIRVRFRQSVEGWMGWTREQVLKPLCKVETELRAFEVEAPSSIEMVFEHEEAEAAAPFTFRQNVQFPKS